MPYKSQTIPIAKTQYDRRRKLTEADKLAIRSRYLLAKDLSLHHKRYKAVSQRSLAREYGVSRRLIVFAIYPERQRENVARRIERGGWKQYYNKEKWRVTMAEHRNYKQKLYMEGKIHL